MTLDKLRDELIAEHLSADIDLRSPRKHFEAGFDAALRAIEEQAGEFDWGAIVNEFADKLQTAVDAGKSPQWSIVGEIAARLQFEQDRAVIEAHKVYAMDLHAKIEQLEKSKHQADLNYDALEKQLAIAESKLLAAEEVVANAMYVGSYDVEQTLNLQEKAERYFNE